MMISVIGGEASGEAALGAAEAVGREIARRGATLVCGGRGGVMEAARRFGRTRKVRTRIRTLPSPRSPEV